MPCPSVVAHHRSHGVQVSQALVVAAKNESEEEFLRRKRAREHELREAEDTGVQVRDREVCAFDLKLCCVV